jgi:hypothetical protein
MTEEQQELYDIVADWWDDVFVGQNGFKGRDACLIDLVHAIMDWKDPPQQHPVEGFE